MKKEDELNKIQKQEKKQELEKMEVLISQFLRFGVLLSAIFIFLGLIMLIITGKSGYDGTFFPDTFQSVLYGVLSFKPYAIILFGLLLLIFTPIFRVGVTIIIFWKNKDFVFLKITIFVFIVLLFSFFMGKVE